MEEMAAGIKNWDNWSQTDEESSDFLLCTCVVR